MDFKKNYTGRLPDDYDLEKGLPEYLERSSEDNGPVDFTIDTVSLVLTPGCNMACDHCMVEGGIKSPQNLETEDYRRFLEEAEGYNPSTISVTGGGEPLLPATYDLSLDLLRIADEETTARLNVVSNLYWATQEDRAEEVTREIYDTGANEIAPSWDLFHAEHYETPVENPLVNVIEASKGLDEFGVLPQIAFTPSNANKTARKLERVADEVNGEIIWKEGEDYSLLKIPGYSGYEGKPEITLKYQRTVRQGTAKTKIDKNEFQLEQGEQFLDEQCPVSESREAKLSLMPDGSMLPCCAGPALRNPEKFSLGKYPDQSVNDALRNESSSPALKAITRGSIQDAVEVLEEQTDVEESRIEEILNSEYDNVCGVCNELVEASEGS